MGVSFSKKILFKFNKKFRIRLERSKRFQYPFYFIVVTNSRDGILKTIGYYNPKRILLRESFTSSYNKYNKLKIGSKLFGVDIRVLCMWLSRGAMPSGRLYRVFKQIGVFKIFGFSSFYNSSFLSSYNNNKNKFVKYIVDDSKIKNFKHHKEIIIKK